MKKAIEELEKNKKEIDEIIEKYSPKKYTSDNIVEIIGEPVYEYDLNAFNKALAEPIWDLLNRGGKRWRPSLFLMVTEALGGEVKKAKELLAIPEIVHNGTLMIDDLEDDSNLRRGKPAIHKIYGKDIAANTSNTMYYLPLNSLAKNKHLFDAKTLLDIYEVYSQEMVRLGFGQATDIYWHKHPDNAKGITEQQYLEMCYNKTGCLARMSAKLAAIISKADEETINKIGNFAGTIGVAFQIQDDILNLTATSNKGQFTKEYIGSDITEGKRTLMVIHTLNNATPEDKKRLEEILAKHTKDKQEIQEAISIIKKYGSIEYARQKAKQLMQESWKEIDGILPPSEAKEKLRSFAKYLIERDV